MKKQLTPTSYEVIPIQETTHVRFYTSIHSGSYVPPHWHDAIEIVHLQDGDLGKILGKNFSDILEHFNYFTNPNLPQILSTLNPGALRLRGLLFLLHR